VPSHIGLIITGDTVHHSPPMRWWFPKSIPTILGISEFTLTKKPSALQNASNLIQMRILDRVTQVNLYFGFRSPIYSRSILRLLSRLVFFWRTILPSQFLKFRDMFHRLRSPIGLFPPNSSLFFSRPRVVSVATGLSLSRGKIHYLEGFREQPPVFFPVNNSKIGNLSFRKQFHIELVAH